MFYIPPLVSCPRTLLFVDSVQKNLHIVPQLIAGMTMPRGPILLTLFLKKYFYLFIFGCIGSLLLSRLFSSWVEQGPLSRCGAWAPHCRGLSGCRARVSVVTAWRLSSCDAQALEHRLNSYGAQTLLVSGMWDLPASGIEPVSPALQADSLPLSH